MNASRFAGVSAEAMKYFFLCGCTSFKNHIAHEVHFMCTKGREEIINGRSAICVAISACGLPVECIVAVLCCVCSSLRSVSSPDQLASQLREEEIEQRVAKARASETERRKKSCRKIKPYIVGRIFVLFVDK